MSSHMIPSKFVKSVLQNGVGRYICQLQRLTLKFCKERDGSRGTRDFIEEHMVDFCRDNPGVVVYLQPRRHRAAMLQAEFLNGRMESMRVEGVSVAEVCHWIDWYRCSSGEAQARLRKYWHTDSPSVQGIWTPFTNEPTEMNVTEFPSTELSQAPVLGTSATQKVLELAREMEKSGQDFTVEEETDSAKRILKQDPHSKFGSVF